MNLNCSAERLYSEGVLDLENVWRRGQADEPGVVLDKIVVEKRRVVYWLRYRYPGTNDKDEVFDTSSPSNAAAIRWAIAEYDYLEEKAK